MKKFAALTLIIFLFCGTSFGTIVMNNISEIFPPGYKPEIEKKLVLGSVAFLRAYGISNELLSVFESAEISNFDTNSSLNLVNNALLEIEKSLNHYKEAKALGLTAGYLPEKTETLRNFDYDSFSKTMQYTGVFEKVKRFMVNNDVIGIHAENIKNIEVIREDLIGVRKVLSAGGVPAKEQMWKILVDYTNASIFANYATRIGSTALSN